MTQTCRPAKCIEAVRVALLDQCTLLPVCGPMTGYAMGCLIDTGWNPEILEGENSEVIDSCGNICLEDTRCDRTKRHNIEFKIKGPDPEFLALVSGDTLIVDGGISIGVRELSYSCSPYVFLELFERTDDCGVDGDPVYFRHVFPAVRLKQTGNEREGVFRILQMEGKTKDVLVSSVGSGPYFDIPASAFTSGNPYERTDYAWFEDTVVPDIVCGAIEVECPFTIAAQCGCDLLITVPGGGLLGTETIIVFLTAPLGSPNPVQLSAGIDFTVLSDTEILIDFDCGGGYGGYTLSSGDDGVFVAFVGKDQFGVPIWGPFDGSAVIDDTPCP